MNEIQLSRLDGVYVLASASGGVGRTSLAAALGHHMAGMGSDVLLIDLDPKGSLSSLVGAAPEAEGALCAGRSKRPTCRPAAFARQSSSTPAAREGGRWELPGWAGARCMTRGYRLLRWPRRALYRWPFTARPRGSSGVRLGRPEATPPGWP
jgi:hypothetical protein